MSERGRGSEPLDDELGGDDDGGHDVSARYPASPAAARPIAPYDPYRSPSDAARHSRRNVAAGGFEPPVTSRVGDRGPFLPDDDPLNAEAWQLELGEIAETDLDNDPGSAPDRDTPPAPRRERRQSASRVRREVGSAPGRAPRRGRPAPARGRPSVTLAMPRVVTGSSLVTDQTMLALLGVNMASILIMALLLGVRLGGLPATMVVRLDAAGNPALWGAPGVLWRLPLMSLFITAMFLAVAWFLHPVDRFAARFALAAAVVAQVIAWVAVFKYLA